VIDTGKVRIFIKTLLRSWFYFIEKKLQRARFAFLPAPQDGWPRLLGISFPKSGTHLLDQILLGFSKVAPFSTRLHSFYAEYDGETGRKHSISDAISWLDSLRPLDIASAHLFAHPKALARVTTPAFLPYFIFRDPRDVAVSHVFYVTDMELNHVHHPYYASLPDFDARLKVSILGRPGADVEFPDLAGRFAPYLGWLEESPVLKIHFEDLVNDRRAALGGITDHFLTRTGALNISRAQIIDLLETSINPKKSPTFRSGKIGEWKKYFTPEHKRLFKGVAGNLLIQLGYERTYDW